MTLYTGKSVFFAFILIFSGLSLAHADKIVISYDEKAIKSIIGEAENQGYDGMLAIACAIRNRGTLKGVYGLNAPRVKNNKYTKRIYLEAKQAWETSKKLIQWGGNYDASGGANHWENINQFGKPYWADKCIQTVIIKDHVFYRC